MIETIFINVIDFPGGLLTPVKAFRQFSNYYKILEESDDPDHDVWEFTKGDIVKCEKIQFSEGEFGLVAKSLYVYPV